MQYIVKIFLRTSPELYHKRILGEGVGKIYEIGRCFRHGEIEIYIILNILCLSGID